ncbi:MAG TPA: M13 family metallopeptidase [Polyangia bacterium]|jgi:endothelin-converting enzyme/putative endopeptidase|nr:M13 family metallopeptidase [Polyangia bacterium]
MRSRLWLHGLICLTILGPLAPRPSFSAARPKKQKPAQTQAPATPATPSLTEAGVDEGNLDRSVNPCDDFYHFACGGWEKTHEIPPDRARWGSFTQIDERNLSLLRQILEADAAGKGDPQDAYRDKLGDFWAACMDEGKIEAGAAQDLKAELGALERVKDAPSLARAAAHLQLAYPGNGPLFGFSSEQDFKDATQVIAGFDQGGLGLPDRDYYLKDDGKFPGIRKAYQEHMVKMFGLAGETPEQAARSAEAVLRIERALAEASLSRVDRRDPNKIYHRLNLVGLESTAPRFPWKEFLREAKHPEVKDINVAVPAFFTALNQLVAKEKMDAWRAYLRWNAIRGAAPYLSRAFVDENFRFYGQTLNGLQELSPRWKRCINAADRALGEALSQPFVRATFGAEGKKTTQEMVLAIEAAMKENLDQLSWMDAATRMAALEKLHEITNKIGYPDKWRNYDALLIDRASYFQNVLRATEFESQRDLNKIGKPLDKTEWGYPPTTVNASYYPSLNQMTFPAGILQPPFFGRAAWLAVNYGAIGMVMGHELTHGFDDEGRQFDAKGNLRDWWSPEVGKRFDERAACVVKQYDGYVAVDDLHVNGKLTLGENIADLGGLKLAWRAFQMAQKAAVPNDKAKVGAGGFTPEQLFFLGTAQAWCSKTRPENVRVRVVTDPHSPPEYRVNGPISNLPEFGTAFQCRPGSRMMRADRCEVW